MKKILLSTLALLGIINLSAKAQELISVHQQNISFADQVFNYTSFYVNDTTEDTPYLMYVSYLQLLNSNMTNSSLETPACLFFGLNASASYLRSCNFLNPDILLNSTMLYYINEDLIKAQFESSQGNSSGSELNGTSNATNLTNASAGDMASQNATLNTTEATNASVVATQTLDLLAQNLIIFNAWRIQADYPEFLVEGDIYQFLPEQLQSLVNFSAPVQNQSASNETSNATGGNVTVQNVTIDNMTISNQSLDNASLPVLNETVNSTRRRLDHEPGHMGNETLLDNTTIVNQTILNETGSGAVSGDNSSLPLNGSEQVDNSTSGQNASNLSNATNQTQNVSQGLTIAEIAQDIVDSILTSNVSNATQNQTGWFWDQVQNMTVYMQDQYPNLDQITQQYKINVEEPLVAAIIDFFAFGIQKVQKFESLISSHLGLKNVSIIQQVYDSNQFLGSNYTEDLFAFVGVNEFLFQQIMSYCVSAEGLTDNIPQFFCYAQGLYDATNKSMPFEEFVTMLNEQFGVPTPFLYTNFQEEQVGQNTTAGNNSVPVESNSTNSSSGSNSTSGVNTTQPSNMTSSDNSTVVENITVPLNVTLPDNSTAPVGEQSEESGASEEESEGEVLPPLEQSEEV